MPTEYLEHSGDDDAVLYMTNVDLALFQEHYDVHNYEPLSGWKFHGMIGLFKEYIDYWMSVKIEATLTDNEALRTLAKLMLNALYGKFALNPNVQSKLPYYENGMVQYKLGEKEKRDPIYIPMGAFITSWARNTTIRAAQSVYDRFVYADTDSLHLIGSELPKELNISPTELGAWKHELNIIRGKYIRAKTYMELGYPPLKAGKKDIEWDLLNKTELKITVAGMPDGCHGYVNWDNFSPGNSFPGKLQHTRVNGGVVLKDILFTLKA
jgi:hypothetical protein